MAETPLGTQLTKTHGIGQRAIIDKVIAQMLTIWPMLNIYDLDATQTTWLNMAVEIVLAGRKESEDLAAGYLTTFYAAELPGYQPTIIKPGLDETVRQAIRTSLEVTGPVRIKQLTSAGYAPEYAAQSAFKASTGAAQRHTVDGGREAVVRTAEADLVTQGWRRVIVGDTCPFCRMLAARGNVYSSDTVKFAAHDNDDCVAEPAIAGDPVDLNQYTASKRNVSQAEKDRLRQYLRSEYGDPTREPKRSTEQAPKEVRDVDAGKTPAELRATLEPLQRSYEKFPTPAVQKRIADLEAKIAQRS